LTTRPTEAPRGRRQRVALLSLVVFVQVTWVAVLVYLVLHFL
jgi:hypothetical protein